MSFSNHHMFRSINLMSEISAPLKSLGLTYFSYMCPYQNGSHIRLANHSAWLEYYYQHAYHLIAKEQLPDRAGLFLWRNFQPYPLFSTASNEFDLDNGAIIMLKDGDAIESYSFGAHKANQSVTDIYLHHPELLHQFILHFKEKAHDLIQAAKKSPIAGVSAEKLLPETLTNISIQNFLHDVKIKHVMVNIAGNDVRLAAQEVIILSLMKEGLTAKEIAQEMSLKHKTVEAYQLIIKEKLFLNKKSNLLKCIQHNDLIDVAANLALHSNES